MKINLLLIPFLSIGLFFIETIHAEPFLVSCDDSSKPTEAHFQPLSSKDKTKLQQLLQNYINTRGKAFKLAKPDAKAIAPDELTSLYLGAAFGEEELLQFLLAQKVDVNLTSENGTTPLLMASQNGHFEVVKALLTAKADVNLADKNEVTPLRAAFARGYSEIVQVFVAAKK